jgi:cell division protein FtsB
MHDFLTRYRPYLTIQNGTIVLAFVIAMGWIWGTVETLQKNFIYQQRVDALTQDVELEKLRNQNLAFQQEYYRSEEFLELSARQRLGKADPGEKLIILPDSRNITDTAPVGTEPVTTVARGSNLSQWLQFFFGDKPSS